MDIYLQSCAYRGPGTRTSRTPKIHRCLSHLIRATYLWNLCSLHRLPCAIDNSVGGDLLAGLHDRVEEVHLGRYGRLRRRQIAMRLQRKLRGRIRKPSACAGDSGLAQDGREARRTEHSGQEQSTDEFRRRRLEVRGSERLCHVGKIRLRAPVAPDNDHTGAFCPSCATLVLVLVIRLTACCTYRSVALASC